MKLLVLEKPAAIIDMPLLAESFDLSYNPEHRILQIGRHHTNDIVISDYTMSRHHAELLCWEQGLFVRDLGSKNGTRINGELIESYRGVFLHPTDKLQFGSVVVALEAEGQGTEVESQEGGGQWSVTGLEAPKSEGGGQGAEVQNPKSKIQNLKSEVAPHLRLNLAALIQDSDSTLIPSSVSASYQATIAKGTQPSVLSPQSSMPLNGSRSEIIARVWLPWCYLLLIALAELLTAAINIQLGLILHVLVLIALVAHATLTHSDAQRHLTLTLTLAPLIRLLSLSLPLTEFPQIAWYPIVAIPLLLAATIVTRQLGLSRRTLGLQIGKLPLQLALIVGGFGLGAIEYIILRPNPLINVLSWQTLILPAISFVIFTGFTEELIFRGMLQATTLPVLKRWALLYVSLLFAVMHIGYLSLTDVFFVFAVGLLFAYLVKWGGSLLGVSLAHGLTNITLFLIMPYLEQNPLHPLRPFMLWLIIAGTIAALSAIFILALQAGVFRRTISYNLKEQTRFNLSIEN